MKKDIAIAFKNVSKSYKPNLGFKSILKTYFGFDDKQKPFKVLDNLTFNIHKGDFFFILGDNGVGKSTLLKMISGVLKPSSGSIEINGKVDAIHELTAGFNYELNGYDNLKLLAAIKNIQDKELQENLDDIIAFSELSVKDFEKPLKYYSSGMKTRLAYAMSITFVKGILLLDEVLAVGDYKFRNKCINKIEEIKDSGVTVVMVTHDISQVAGLVTNGVKIKNRKIEFYNNYNDYYLSRSSLYDSLKKFPKTTKGFKFKGLKININGDKRFLNTKSTPNSHHFIIKPIFNTLYVCISFESLNNYQNITLGISFQKIDLQEPIFECTSKKHAIEQGINHISSNFKLPKIGKGIYFIDIYVVNESDQLEPYYLGNRILVESRQLERTSNSPILTLN